MSTPGPLPRLLARDMQPYLQQGVSQKGSFWGSKRGVKKRVFLGCFDPLFDPLLSTPGQGPRQGSLISWPVQQKGPPEGPISRTPFWPVCTRKRLKTGPKKGPPKGPVLASETGLFGLRMALEWWGPRWPYPLVEWAQSPGTRQEAVLGVPNYPSFGGSKRGVLTPKTPPF